MLRLGALNTVEQTNALPMKLRAAEGFIEPGNTCSPSVNTPSVNTPSVNIPSTLGLKKRGSGATLGGLQSFNVKLEHLQKPTEKVNCPPLTSCQAKPPPDRETGPSLFSGPTSALP